MNRLTTEQRVRAVACLVEGTSQRATCRITGLSRKGVARLAEDLGNACHRFADRVFRDLSCERIQCDEIWSFVGCKEKAKKRAVGKHPGDVWTWVAIDPETKLIPAWHIGCRDAEDAYRFMLGVAKRIKNRLQLSTDGHKAYLIAVEAAFVFRPIDYGTVVKIYGDKTETGKYSPGEVIGTVRQKVSGNPEMTLTSTSHAERSNLTMRIQMRRFTRLTNAFSKKLECHRAAVALHFLHYNFCRIHQTLRVTPAMEAGLADRVWGLDDLIALLVAEEALPCAA